MLGLQWIPFNFGSILDNIHYEQSDKEKHHKEQLKELMIRMTNFNEEMDKTISSLDKDDGDTKKELLEKSIKFHNEIQLELALLEEEYKKE